MEATTPSLDLLWKLSEIERQLAAQPDARGYLKLAAGYAEAGWSKEAARAAQRATALTHGAASHEVESREFSGPCSPRVLLELLRALHLTAKTGELRLDAPGGVNVSLVLVSGQLVDAQSSDAARGEPSIFRASLLQAARYTFIPGPPRADVVSITAVTGDLLTTLGERVKTV